jgi:Lysyl oxidase
MIRSAAIAIAGCTAVATASLGVATTQAATTPGPQVKLIPAQNSITAQRFGQQVFLDPGIYVASLRSALEFDVQRASYSQPLTITQVIHLPGGSTQTVPLPATVLAGWSGLRNFLHVKVTNSSGMVVASTAVAFCPNDFNPQKATPNAAVTSPYTFACFFNPFQLGSVWGLARGWATDPLSFGAPFRLGLGTYHVTETIAPGFVQLLNISAADATATVKVKVVKGTGCCGASHRSGRTRAGALPRLPSAPTLTNPPASALPDMVALPAFGISTSHARATPGHPASDYLNFGANVWIGGNSQLDVQGFRSNGSPVMKAYQYFWQDGHIIGRARAGTMGFDSKPGHTHWHFQQFAQYRLLKADKSLAVRSHKVGFCIAPTDAINLMLPNAVWQPPFTGFGGACGSPTALWVQEALPLGWGDTYFQSLAGQSFTITNLPNGTYHIEVIANPEHVLFETTTSNDVSLRKVILGGTPGHRTVRVPAYQGIDPEP